jgi:hypothetical protein
MRLALAIGLCLLLLPCRADGREGGSVRVREGYLGELHPFHLDLGVSCVLGYYYLLEGCGYVTVMEGIEQGEAFGVHFRMTDSIPWDAGCDTNACMTLDAVGLVLYDALAPPADQSMNIKIYGADAGGNPSGSLLGNRDFEVEYSDTAAFTSVEIDFTNGGVEPGLDVSGCCGDFIVLLTWKNSTGHPCLVLDNMGTCVDSCSADPACCEMGNYPYVYPRLWTHTYYYGSEWAWSKQDSFCDLGGCGTYGYLEALWECGFCTKSTATEPTTWGGIKAIYR